MCLPTGHDLSCANLAHETELKQGKLIKIKKFSGAKRVKLFRVTVSTNRTEFIVTNDSYQNSMKVVQQVYNIPWKVEEFHRELKQLTGVESCQCRKGRIQRNHIACAITASSARLMTSGSDESLYQPGSRRY